MKVIIHLLSTICFVSTIHCQTQQELTKNKDWDLEQLEFDISNLQEPQTGLMTMGAFPVKKYKGAAGVSPYIFQVGQTNILCLTFFVGKHKDNKHLYKSTDSHIGFFTVVCPIESEVILSDDYTNNLVLSRNHPNYLGQGYINNQHFPIEYLSFVDGKNEGHAIINLKLFDLDYGNLILVAPQQDKSLRFLQLSSVYLNMETAHLHFKSLLEKDEVLDFFDITKAPVKQVVKSSTKKDYLEKRIEVKFTNQMTKEDLERIQKDMKAEKIELTFPSTEYDEQGKLKSIFFVVKTNDGFSGTATSIDLIRNPIGFYRDYNEGAKSSFGTGKFWK